MPFDPIIKSVFFVLTIVLFSLAFVIFYRASHLKGQRLAAGILVSFGLVYFFELILYMNPNNHGVSSHFWLVGMALMFGFSLTLHYIYFLISKHTIIKSKSYPYIFYVYFIIYVSMIGPFEILTGFSENTIQNGWFSEGRHSLPLYMYIILPIIIFQILYFLAIGMKYAPSNKRKKLYKTYFYGVLGSLFLSLLAITLLSSQIISTEIFVLISCIPLVLTIGIENYHYSPGFAKHYNKIIQISPIALIVLNRDFKIVEYNIRASQLFKVERYEPIHEYLETEENMKEILTFLTELQRQGELSDYKVTLRFQDEMHLSLVASILELDDEYYYYIMLRDITNEYNQEKKNYYLAYHDSLTTLYNRTYFTNYVVEKFKSLKETEISAVVLSDLNFFKKINDTYGHQIGDEVLIHTANILAATITKPNIVARLGGDEFIIYFDRIESEMFITEQIALIRNTFQHTPFQKGDLVLEVIPSFGYAIGRNDMNYEKIYHKADIEMYKDKRKIKAERKNNEIELTVSK